MFSLAENSSMPQVSWQALFQRTLVLNDIMINTGGIERFSDKENFGNPFKVSYFYLGFLPDKNNNQIKHVQRISLEFSESAFENLDKSVKESENSDKIL